jgi:polyhydroxyalkanoate synthesis regulator phasin
MSRTSWKVKRDLVESKWNTVVLNLIERGDLPQEDAKDYMLNVEKHSSYIRELAERYLDSITVTLLCDFFRLQGYAHFA